MTKVRIRKVGNSLGAIFPADLLHELHLQEGDELTISRDENGIHLSPYDVDFESAMVAFDEVRRDYRNTLRKLAE